MLPEIYIEALQVNDDLADRVRGVGGLGMRGRSTLKQPVSSPDEDCYARLMIRMGTIEELQSQDYRLGLYCLSCERWGEANLDWLIQNGKGKKSVIKARFRCRDCGEIVEKQVRPPVPSLGGTVAYI